MWKRLNFCGSDSTLKKEAGSGKKYSTASTSLLVKDLSKAKGHT